MKQPPVASLADEIFFLVQVDQGFGFISDGLGALPSRQKVFDTVRGALKASERATRKMRRWLKKYGQL